MTAFLLDIHLYPAYFPHKVTVVRYTFTVLSLAAMLLRYKQAIDPASRALKYVISRVLYRLNCAMSLFKYFWRIQCFPGTLYLVCHFADENHNLPLVQCSHMLFREILTLPTGELDCRNVGVVKPSVVGPLADLWILLIFVFHFLHLIWYFKYHLNTRNGDITILKFASCAHLKVLVDMCVWGGRALLTFVCNHDRITHVLISLIFYSQQTQCNTYTK